MATSDKLSEVVVQHIPLVHGQSEGCRIYTPGSRRRRPCSLSLTHSISLNLPNEAVNGDIQGRTCLSSFRNRAGISKHLENFGRVRDDEQILSDSWLQLHREDKDTLFLMDCGEQDWAGETGCDGHVPHITNVSVDCEALNQNQADYISDSSCNSSDGVPVNFSAIYNKTNNAVPATSYELDSPAEHSQESQSGHQDDDFKFNSCWSPWEVDPNCNIYQTDNNGLTSPLITSALTPYQGLLTTYTNNYYKLVTCDLSSQSAASPLWSSLTSCSEAHSHGSMTPPTEYFLFGKPETEDREVVKANQRDLQVW